MYHALLTNRYLTSRVIPLIAVAAVALCVALVIIVVSVMTGFLEMVRTAGRSLMGDVVISYPVTGLPFYEELIDEIEQLPEAEAASALIDTWGLLQMPYPDGEEKEIRTVQVWGVDESFARVTEYDDSLHWRDLSDGAWAYLFRDLVAAEWPALLDMLDVDALAKIDQYIFELENKPLDDPSEHGRRARVRSPEAWEFYLRRATLDPSLFRDALGEDRWREFLSKDERLLDPEAILEQGRTLKSQSGEDAMVTGLHVSVGNTRQHDGSVVPARDWFWWMPRYQVTLTTVPMSSGGGILEPESHIFPVVNEFRSGVYLIDDKRVIIPLARAQRMTGLNEALLTDDDGEIIGEDPARATVILVRATDGTTPEALKEKLIDVYDRFADGVRLDPDHADIFMPSRGFGLSVMTWEEQQRQFIGPIEKERELMRTLFSLIYLVCAGLVLAIFWAIVYEKTRDIGILRSIGASRAGISWIFLRYGLVVGICGAFVGLLLAILVVTNINGIHTAMGDPPLWLSIVFFALAAVLLVVTIVRSLSGRLLPLVLGSLLTVVTALIGVVLLILYLIGGIIFWDPTVYYFSTIPNDVDYGNAWITMIGAVVFSLVGAFIPAAKAADTDPVKALRYE